MLDDLLEDWRAEYRPGWGGVRVVGSRWLASAHALKDFLARNHVPYEFFDVEAADDRGVRRAQDHPYRPRGARWPGGNVEPHRELLGLPLGAVPEPSIVDVVGAGNSAGQAALHLAEYARKVVIVVRGRDLGEKMSQYLVRRIRSCADRDDHPIQVLSETEATRSATFSP